VGENCFVRGYYRLLEGGGQVRLAISGSLKLVSKFFGEGFKTHAAGHFAAKVPAHAIRDCHQQSAILNPDKARLTLLRNTLAIQGENQMIVLVVVPSEAHIGDLRDTRAQAEDALLLNARRR
jgi:hypothetical protein